MSSRSPLRALALGAILSTAVLVGSAHAQATTLKIAVIDVERIIRDSATAKSLLARLEEYGREQEAKLDAKKNEVEQLRKRLADGQLSLADDKLADLRKEIETKTIELRRAGDDAQREFNQRQADALQDIERRVMPVIKKVGEDGGYTLIFRKFDSGLVYAADEVDITPAVITQLDAGIAAAAKPASR
jgi:outer membrane protein